MQPAEASRPAPRLLSISHLTVLDAAPPELVTAAADAGFDAVGIRVWPAADEPAYPMLGDTPMMRETIARLAGTGTHVLDVEVLRLRPDSRMDDLEQRIVLRTSIGFARRVPQEWARNVRVPAFLYQVHDDVLTGSLPHIRSGALRALAVGGGTSEGTLDDDVSTRDRVGHGTALAMAAAGVSVTSPVGTISGVAAVYPIVPKKPSLSYSARSSIARTARSRA